MLKTFHSDILARYRKKKQQQRLDDYKDGINDRKRGGLRRKMLNLVLNMFICGAINRKVCRKYRNRI